jgi:hypothetical protein
VTAVFVFPGSVAGQFSREQLHKEFDKRLQQKNIDRIEEEQFLPEKVPEQGIKEDDRCHFFH